VRSPEFLAAVAGDGGRARARGRHRAAPQQRRGLLPALVKDLRAAQRTIHFSVYIWEPGQASDQVFAALDRARARRA
jgi:phosphatidylserine/phosphatidylglycerophosphate/cardiolipin synthase-like enzyme